MDLSRALEKSSLQNKTKVQRRERHFELSLPALVSGTNVKGEDFEERTAGLDEEDWAEIGYESGLLLKEAGIDDEDIMNIEDEYEAYDLGRLSARLKIASDLGWM